jgi:hypothetical protein
MASLGLLLTTAGACSSEADRADPASSTTADRRALASTTEPGRVEPTLPEELDVQPSLTLGCEGTAMAGPPEDFEVVSDAVALPTSPNHPALQTSRREAADGSIYFFAKTGLIWNETSSFELVVPEALRRRMAIGWGGPAPHSHSVEVSCEGQEGWVGLPGGYWVTEPLWCVPVARS